MTPLNAAQKIKRVQLLQLLTRGLAGDARAVFLPARDLDRTPTQLFDKRAAARKHWLAAPSSSVGRLNTPFGQRCIISHAGIHPAGTLRGLLFFPERCLGLEVVHQKFARLKTRAPVR